ncbi:hypothetical protein B0H16DRAFT_1481427 [Mycena metata]|uniref:Uncharacterized protein n=1 Tax=Mycena metata TaxID=1033252 RepID=A0AAD7MAA9_9AGAR|nr:hypothetical protein B0H16DRAFT_1481427 [Mycena metata]
MLATLAGGPIPLILGSAWTVYALAKPRQPTGVAWEMGQSFWSKAQNTWESRSAGLYQRPYHATFFFFANDHHGDDDPRRQRLRHPAPPTTPLSQPQSARPTAFAPPGQRRCSPSGVSRPSRPDTPPLSTIRPPSVSPDRSQSPLLAHVRSTHPRQLKPQWKARKLKAI